MAIWLITTGTMKVDFVSSENNKVDWSVSGNNLPENEVLEQEDVDEGIDLLNDNLEELPMDNVAAIENNNGREEEEQLDLPVIDVVEEQNDPDQFEVSLFVSRV